MSGIFGVFDTGFHFVVGAKGARPPGLVVMSLTISCGVLQSYSAFAFPKLKFLLAFGNLSLEKNEKRAIFFSVKRVTKESDGDCDTNAHVCALERIFCLLFLSSF